MSGSVQVRIVRLCLALLSLSVAFDAAFGVLTRPQVVKRALVGVSGALLGDGLGVKVFADDRVWISGKNPEKKADPKDKKGTKKDVGYLRCLSQCKSECESAGAGPARGRGECLQSCQDECCESYEQCTYTMRE